MKTLLSLPPNLVGCFHQIEKVSEEDWYCTSDPVGARLGSGGGTTWLLESCWQKENKDIDLIAIWKKRADICKNNFVRTGWIKKLQMLEGNEKQSDNPFLPPAERNKLRKALFEEFTDVVIDIKAASSGVNLDDLSLCLFYLLKVNNATISMCMGVSENALRTRKSRLKEKLDSCMYQFIFGK